MDGVAAWFALPSDALGDTLPSVLDMILPYGVSRVIVYLEPVSMRWGPDKVRTFCAEELGIEPDTKTAFLFTNRKQDTLLMYCVNDDGDTVLMKKLDKGAFLLPAPEHALDN